MGKQKTAFCDFERAFAILGYVTLKSMSDSERPLGVVSGFSVFSLKCRLHGGIGLPFLHYMKEVLYAVRCLKSSEDTILALAGQFKQLSHEPEKFRLNPVESPEFFRFMRQLLKLSSKCEDRIFT